MNIDRKLEKVKSTYSFWGRFPLFYAAQDFITFLGRADFVRKRAVSKMQLKMGGKAIEVACGTGRNFRYLMESLGDKGKLIGFDYTQAMLDAAKELCKEKQWKNIELIQGDAAELRVTDFNFDGILSVLGISAIPNWERALRRCKDLLRVGGIISICDAQLFGGGQSIFNPIVKIVYSNLAAWDPSKNIPSKLKEIFGNISIETYNYGTIFIATSIKE